MISKSINALRSIFLIAVFGGGLSLAAAAADVRVGLSTRETYVGLPVTLQIRVSNASNVEPPKIPQIDGLSIKSIGTPSRSTQITTINGSTTTASTLSYAYEITPERSGSFHIPPITVQADGHDQQTRGLDFVASKSETGDLIFVEIAGKQKDIYVGQALDLTLKIWLRPFRDNERRITLSEGDMWKLISDRTSWGPFADQMQQLADADKRPAGREVVRKDGNGVEHSYYLYEVEATIYPKGTGKIGANDVKVVVDYPTALGKSRDPFAGFFDDAPFAGGSNGVFGNDDFFASPFSSRLTVKSVRPIVANAAVEPINVLPIPAAGRPADYRGAVGKYLIATEANPTNVKAGDPINLLIGISGTGPMELVQAPPLTDLPKLTADFKVPNEPLAGFVKDDRKVFSTSIRPRKEGVTQIPSIPFSYFDPAAKKFVTVHSDPISVHVGPADTLALDAVVHHNANPAADQHGSSESAPTAGMPMLTVFSDDDVLKTETPAVVNLPQLILLLALPPLLILGATAIRLQRSLAVITGRLGTGVRACKTRIGRATSCTDIALALQYFVARLFGIRSATADVATVLGVLRSSGYRDIALRCERIFHDCENDESNRILGSGSHAVEQLKKESLRIIDDLQTEHRRPRPKPMVASRRIITRSRVQTVATRTASALVVASTLVAVGHGAFAAEMTRRSSTQSVAEATAPHSLTVEQQRALLAEAVERYKKAQGMTATDSADAKQAFADAAEKFELLINSGMQNSRLFVNLGNAYLQSGQKGRAIANFQRALRVDPTNRIARTNLTHAEGLISKTTAAAAPQAADAGVDSKSLPTLFLNANDWLNRKMGPHCIRTLMIFAWFALSSAIGLRMLGVHYPWKTIASAAIVIFSIAATSYALSWQESARHLAVVITNDVTIREGDGANFPVVSEGQLREGQTVELGKRRGDWLQIRTENGQSGWLPNTAVEVI